MKSHSLSNHGARLAVCVLFLIISIDGNSTQPEKTDKVLIELKLPNGDITPGYFMRSEEKGEGFGNTFLFRLKVAPSQVYRLSILWLTDEQARVLKVDKGKVLRELVGFASSNNPEDMEKLRRSLVFEKVANPATKQEN